VATSGRLLGNLNDGTRVYLDWQVTSQSQSGNYSNVSWQVGFNFPGSPSCRGLRNGTATINGTEVYRNYNSGDAIHSYSSGHDHTWLQVASGSIRINHNSSGNATLSVSAGMTGWQDKRSTGSDSWALPQIPKAPSTPGTPVASNITATGVTLTWAAPSNNGAALDRNSGQVSRNSAFTDVIASWDVAGWTTSRTITGLPKGTTLYARVRAHNSIGWSAWSGARTFSTGVTTPSAPGAPTISGISATTASVAWSTPSDSGGAAITTYEVQRATSASFDDAVTVTDPASPAPLSDLLPGTTYYVRVRAVSSAGAGAWSSTTTFQTLSGVKVGNGTQWREAIVWVGDGSKWVMAQVKVGNGSTWR
jgi:hypothetical protein